MTKKKKATTEQAAALVLAKPNNNKHQPSPADKRAREDELRYRAKRWAELHAKVKTREEMDTQLLNLTEAEARIVVLNGQRIACGLAPKY